MYDIYKVLLYVNIIFHTDELQKAYLEACTHGVKPIYRAKVNLVGHKNAGKTSLYNRLMDEKFEDPTESTEAIDVHYVRSFFKGKDTNWAQTSYEPKDMMNNFNDFVLSIARNGKHDNKELSQVQRDSEVKSKIEQKGTTDDEVLHLFGKDTTSITKASHENTGDDYVGNISRMNYSTLSQLIDLENSSQIVKDDVPHLINVWDLGGQDEFLTTHHIFINPEATTLIVMDLSKSLDSHLRTDVTGSRSLKTPVDVLHYWLHSIHMQASVKQVQPSVALVLTHRDLIYGNDVDQYVERYIHDILKSLQGKEYASTILRDNIHVVDNKNGNKSEFSMIRGQLIDMISQQKSWGQERPVRWLKLEADILNKAKEESTNYLFHVIIKGMALSYGIGDNELEAFLQFHHTMGDFLYFSEPLLRDIVITNPQWLVDRFKALITAHEFLDKRNLKPTMHQELKQGMVGEETLKTIWAGDDVRFITELMTKHNLIIPLNDVSRKKRFLIPCMLPPMKTDMYVTEPFRNMAFIYNAMHKPKKGEHLDFGTFHTMVSKCSKTLNWQLCEDHLSYTDISFEIGAGLRLALTQLKDTTIRASIWCSKSNLEDDTKYLILNTRKVLMKMMIEMNIAPSDTFLMFCPCWASHDKEICMVELKEVIHCKEDVADTTVTTKRCPLHGLPMSQSNFTWWREKYHGKSFFNYLHKILCYITY